MLPARNDITPDSSVNDNSISDSEFSEEEDIELKEAMATVKAHKINREAAILASEQESRLIVDGYICPE
jgi:hypothetical protein